MNPLWLPLYILVGALANRIRGGLIPLPSTQLARLGFATIIAGLVLVLTADWRAALLAIPATFLGTLAGHGDAMHLGRHGHDLWLDILSLAGSGLVNTGLLAATLWAFDFDPLPLLAAGLLKPAAYEAGWRVPSRIHELETGPPVAEAVFGALIGAALWISA